MSTVLITIHLIVVLFLIVIVLLQRSEGGGLGIGGGGGGMMNARKAGDGLTRTTGILAAAFFVTSLGLGVLARYDDSTGGAFDRAEQLNAEDLVPSDGGGVLDSLGGELPATEAPVEVPAADPTGVPIGE